MNSLRKLFRVVMLCSSLDMAARASAADLYRLTDLGDLPGGNDKSTAYGINNRGQVVGWSHTATGDRAFVWDNGAMIELGDLPDGENYSRAYDISDSGVVVGESGGAAGICGFRWQGGTMTDVGNLYGGGSGTQALCVNSRGQIVGSSDGVPFIVDGAIISGLDGIFGGLATGINEGGQVTGHTGGAGWIWLNGMVTYLGTLPGGRQSQATEINDRGEVVGMARTAAGAYRAFLWDKGTMVELGLGNLPAPPSSGGVSAFGINNHAEIVGYSFDAHLTPQRPFICTPAGTRDLNGLLDGSGAGWTLRGAYAINDAGQIAGMGITPQGRAHAYLLTPVPEPAAIVGLALGVAVLRVRR